MTEERIALIEGNLLAVTDQVGRLMDLVLQKGFVPVFVCNHSGLYLPGDYVKQWGRKYGIGLGPSPVSEVLDSDYDTDPPEITRSTRSIEQIMHPVGPSFAQVDMLLVSPDQVSGNLAVTEAIDPDMVQRARIIRAKQLANPRGRLRVMQTKWDSQGRGA